jgi:class 3 adenylate cyclase/tetratricopeptide (TPR) repeat protein
MPEARAGSPRAGACGAVSARKERKFATALFADVVGSTALVEREDPEVVQALLQRLFERIEREVERHGGLIEKFIGDAALAVFGLPTAHEDDPERAVRAALAVQAAAADLSEALVAEGRPRVALRIGIEAGEILVDLDRVEGPRHRMLTGDAVNTAARLEQAAEPGQVVVGPAVHEVTERQVAYRSLPPLELRGKTLPVPAWAALHPIPAATGDRVPLRLQAAIVGRDEELLRLTDALERVRVSGGPMLVTVLGPAGIGKSRLTHEFLGRLGRSGIATVVRRGRCRSYGDVPYAALAEIMASECGILDPEAPGDVHEKVVATVRRLAASRDLVAPLEVLLGTGRDLSFQRAVLFDAWRTILEAMALRSALVLVLEDVHWADDGLLDFVEHLADWVRAPILIVVLARPELMERRPGWGRDRPRRISIPLDALSGPEAEAVIEGLLAPGVPVDLVRVVHDSAGGNPLFIEEIVRALFDRGLIREACAGHWELAGPVAAVDVPRSIHGLISSRLDALPAADKAILQDASVVGRTFWAGAVARLSGYPEVRVRRILRGVGAKGLVATRRPSSIAGEAEFTFHHALIRDVAYDSLPKALRASKHLATARWTEQQAGDRSDEIAAVLATHHRWALHWMDELGEASGMRSEAEREGYRWARAAGQRAQRVWQQPDAVRWLRLALDLGERLGLPDGELAPAWESYARALDGVVALPEVVAAWNQALLRYERLGADGDAGRVEASIAHACLWSGDAPATRRRARRAVRRLDPLGETPDLAFALFVLGRQVIEHGEVAAAEPLLRRAQAIAGRVGDRGTEANAMISLGWALHARRRGEETVRLFDEALDVARDTGDLGLVLGALEAVLSAAIEVTGDYARAERLCREAGEVARRSGNLHGVARASLNLGYLMVEVGRLDEAETSLQAASEAASGPGDPTIVASIEGERAIMHGRRGELTEAQRALDARRAVVQAANLDSVPYLEEFDGLIGAYIAMGHGRHEEAAEILVEASGRVSDARLSVWLGQALLFEGVRVLVGLGRPAEAGGVRDRLQRLATSNVPPRAYLAWADGLLAADPMLARAHLGEAVARFEALGRRVDLARCLADLARVTEDLGEDPGPTRERARGILEACGAGLFAPAAHPAEAPG